MVTTAEEQMEQAQTRLAEQLKKELIQAVIGSTIVQTGIQVGLNYIPIVGQALSALYSLTNYIVGKKNKEDIDNIIKNAQVEIQRLQKQTQENLEAFVGKISEEEIPNAKKLVMSQKGYPSAGINGYVQRSSLGFIDKVFEDVRDAIKKAIDKVGQELRDLPADLASGIKHAVNEIQDIPKDAKKLAEKLRQEISDFPEDLESRVKKLQQEIKDLPEDIKRGLEHLQTELRETTQMALDYITGRVAVNVARDKARAMVQAAKEGLNKIEQREKARINSSEGRQQIREVLAEKLSPMIPEYQPLLPPEIPPVVEKATKPTIGSSFLPLILGGSVFAALLLLGSRK